MKRFFGLAILAAGLAIPAHAQTLHGYAAGGAASSATSSSGGGGYGGGGFGGGLSGGGTKLASYPVAHFGVASVSGSQQDYVPSTFVAYDKALAEGRDILANPPKSVVEAAHEQVGTQTEKARLALVQDDHGNAIVVSR